MANWGLKIAVVLSLAWAGCAHEAKVVAETPQDEPYRIGAEDVLDVSVWKDPELSRTVPVRPDGYISLPLAGDVLAAGKTDNELAAEIKQKLAPWVQEPHVAVMLKEINSSRVFVTGEVTHPGAYPIRGKTSLLQAIALAGGFSAFANTDGMMVIRQGTGKIPVRYSDLTADDGQRKDFVLKAGDTVVVP